MYNIVNYTPDTYYGTIIVLPGRGQTAYNLLHGYSKFSGVPMQIIGIDPFDEWYPIPNGENDQMNAVWGLKISVPDLDICIKKIEKDHNVNRSEIVLAGFSAGAVMAIQIASTSDEPFGGVVVHNGAILEPDKLLPSKHKTPFLLFHNQNDDCFDWKERYIPMKNAFIEKNYKIKTIENDSDGHYISKENISDAGEWIAEIFNLSIQERNENFDPYLNFFE
jgi:phospholipase/carboxylesterase